MRNPISRRTLLQGAGVAMALPWLESMAKAAKKKGKGEVPCRLMFLSYPFPLSNYNNSWFPKEAGSDYTMTPGLKPLEAHRKDFTVFSNLTNKNGAGPHSGCTTWLTGADLRHLGPGYNGVSCDQVAAEHLGKETRFDSLVLSEPGEGGHGPGMSLSWGKDGRSVPGIGDPVALFNFLFGSGSVSVEERRHQLKYKKSVLDLIGGEARSVERRVSANDKEKLDEYFHSIRDIELRLSKDERWLDEPVPEPSVDQPPPGLSASEKVKMMYDLMVAAMQADLTRVLSYRHMGRPLLQEFGGGCSLHQMSHHKDSGPTLKVAMKRDEVHSELLAYLFDRMKAIQEANGKTLFDNSLIAFGNSLRHGHGNRNAHTLLAGYGGGGIRQGNHLVYKESETALCDLWLTMLTHAGVPVDSFSDSDGVLPELLS